MDMHRKENETDNQYLVRMVTGNEPPTPQAGVAREESGYDPEYLKLWTMPRDYCGEVWPDYYSAGVGQSRDSDALERSNFRSMLALLGGESETVIVVRESHWAVGWVEWIAIHSTDYANLKIADEAKAGLDSYAWELISR